MRRVGRVDAGAYVRALALLARNPSLALAPLAAFLFEIALLLLPVGGLGGQIMILLGQCAIAFGLSVAIIFGDRIWRSANGRAVFGDAFEEAKRKAPEIVMATFGFTFVLYAASLVGSLTGSALIAAAFVAVALFFAIYTLPAAAIGGLPGGIALQASVSRAQANKANALLATFAFAFVWGLSLLVLPLVVGEMTGSERVGELTLLGQLVCAVIRAILAGYLGLVLAKSYADTI